MKKISLDTNAVLDFCYRFYGNEIFTKLWEDLSDRVISKQICFYIVPSIKEEIEEQIVKQQLEPQYFADFIDKYKVLFPKTDEFGSSTISLKEHLLNFAAAIKSHHVTKDNYGDADIVSFARYQGKDAIVLTSETSFKLLNWDNPSHNHNIKVPNLCDLFQVDCMNWYSLFNYLGQKY